MNAWKCPACGVPEHRHRDDVGRWQPCYQGVKEHNAYMKQIEILLKVQQIRRDAT